MLSLICLQCMMELNMHLPLSAQLRRRAFISYLCGTFTCIASVGTICQPLVKAWDDNGTSCGIHLEGQLWSVTAACHCTSPTLAMLYLMQWFKSLLLAAAAALAHNWLTALATWWTCYFLQLYICTVETDSKPTSNLCALACVNIPILIPLVLPFVYMYNTASFS